MIWDFPLLFFHQKMMFCLILLRENLAEVLVLSARAENNEEMDRMNHANAIFFSR